MLATPFLRVVCLSIALGIPFPVQAHAETDPSADAAWHRVEDLQHRLQADAPAGENEVEFYAPIETELHQAASEFAARYPDDPRRWEAELTVIRSQQFPVSADERREIFTNNEFLLAEILAAPNAAPKTKQLAERAVIRQYLDHLDLITTPSMATNVEARLADYLRRFPDDPKAANMQVRRIDLWQRADPAKAAALLDEMAANPDAQIAAAARGRQAQKNLFSAPLDWKLPGIDGNPIDLPGLRGKAVLIQFWASWCPDCNREMPAVLDAYRQFHDRGLEIVGVSLDKDKAALLATLKKKNIAWPQFFDGKYWNNEVAVRYGVRGIPELWLVDTAGRVVATGVQADQLAARIPPLLPNR